MARMSAIYRFRVASVALGKRVVSNRSIISRLTSSSRLPRRWVVNQRIRCTSSLRDFLCAFSFSHRKAASSQVRRSEEHTSELQSLMSTSYAVFRSQYKKKHRIKLHQPYKTGDCTYISRL